ncbi:MAG: heparan-alpha-glucosaminide N-acetyltransferase domain-containing protein [Dysgonomonas sp.]|nr:heparan-alpha-glucosaminide N-acetyltransferase domain-containing protein [Dysgonomonas sp.]
MRLRNIDLLRGIVMVLMCIDHARDYTHFHPTDPMIVEETIFPVYILRILAHFCAPVFILLAGISARLSGKRKSVEELSKYLFTRGLILCLLEITLVNWAWNFNPAYKVIYLQIIWAIGISMVTLSFLIYLKDKYILLFSLIIIAGHNLFDNVTFEEGTCMYYLWSFLLQKNVLPIADHLSVRTTYPVLPVMALMGLAYVLGRLYTEKSSEYRQKVFIISGIIGLILFFILRLLVGYGDPYRWQVFDNNVLTIMSIFNVTKYPFSLQFLLITLSVAFLYLGFTDAKCMSVKVSVIELIGKTPMFFYILHIYILHSIALLTVLYMGISPDFVNNLGGIPSDFGVPLWWLWWMIPLTVLGLYPLCKKYLALKQSKKYKWTAYI